MRGTMSMEVLKQRREEMLSEAGLNRLKKALRAERKRPAASRWVSTVVWDLARGAGLLREFFEAKKR